MESHVESGFRMHFMCNDKRRSEILPFMAPDAKLAHALSFCLRRQVSYNYILYVIRFPGRKFPSALYNMHYILSAATAQHRRRINYFQENTSAL